MRTQGDGEWEVETEFEIGYGDMRICGYEDMSDIGRWGCEEIWR